MSDEDRKSLEFEIFDDVANTTMSPNGITKRHRSHVLGDKVHHRPTMSPSNNVIDDNYKAKDHSRQSDDSIGRQKQIFNDMSGGRKEGISKKMQSYKNPSNLISLSRKEMANTFSLKLENQMYINTNLTDQNKNGSLEEPGTQKLLDIVMKNSSDNEVDDNEFDNRENEALGKESETAISERNNIHSENRADGKYISRRKFYFNHLSPKIIYYT